MLANLAILALCKLRHEYYARKRGTVSHSKRQFSPSIPGPPLTC